MYPMSSTDWMIPRVSLSAEAHLQSMLTTLDTHGERNPEETVRFAKSLAQQTVVQQAIIRQAVGHIAELEMVLFLLQQQPRPPWWKFWARRR